MFDPIPAGDRVPVHRPRREADGLQGLHDARHLRSVPALIRQLPRSMERGTPAQVVDGITCARS